MRARLCVPLWLNYSLIFLSSHSSAQHVICISSDEEEDLKKSAETINISSDSSCDDVILCSSDKDDDFDDDMNNRLVVGRGESFRYKITIKILTFFCLFNSNSPSRCSHVSQVFCCADIFSLVWISKQLSSTNFFLYVKAEVEICCFVSVITTTSIQNQIVHSCRRRPKFKCGWPILKIINRLILTYVCISC